MSNYLNRPEVVSSDTSERIASAIAALGFIPDVAGRRLRRGFSDAFGFLIPDVANPYLADIAERVEKRAAERGISVFLANSYRQRSREDAYLHAFEEQRVRGLIVSSHLPIEARLAEVRERGTPSVLVGQRALDPAQPSVRVDDFDGGMQVGRHLAEIGCRRIAVVGGPPEVPQVADRVAGARLAWEQCGHRGLEIIDTPDRTIERGRIVGRALLDRDAGSRPDGIFAMNDLLALGLLQVLTAGGVRVPEDLALAGYDDTEFSAASLIPLTTVRVRDEGLGAAVVNVLFDAIAGKPAHELAARVPGRPRGSSEHPRVSSLRRTTTTSPWTTRC